jgi:basic membrane protein A
MAGFSWSAALEKVAVEYPDIKFAIIDMVVDKPNVRSVVFKEEEGGWLAGILAGMASKTKTVSFVGGMDIPLIHKFACGYIGGAKSLGLISRCSKPIRHDAGRLERPGQGRRNREVQFDQGSDVVYHAAGGTGVGVLQAAADAGKLGIGVDSNQNGLHPGKVLTSMVKRVDVAVYDAFITAKNDTFKPGVNVLGLKESGVDVAMDDNNAPLITAEMKAAIDKARADIDSGAVKVHDYMSDETCPY